MQKILNSSEYTFDASAKTITFSGAFSSLELPHIKVITNVTDNIMIYQFNEPTLGGSLTGLVLTLDYDTTSMSDTDELQIYMEADFLGSTSGLTDAELRASPIDVNTGLKQYTKGDVEDFAVGNLAMGYYTDNDEFLIQPLRTDNNGILKVRTTPEVGNGQQAMANSASVVIASDQSPISVTETNPLVQYNEGGALISATGPVILARDSSTGNAKPLRVNEDGLLQVHLSEGVSTSINSISGVQGQQLMANSFPVVLASDHSDIPVSISGTVSIDSTGLATEAKQDIINSVVYAKDDVDATPNTVLISGLYNGDTIKPLSVNGDGRIILAAGEDDLGAIITNGTGALAVNIQDGGNSITVDGTFWQATQPISAISLPLPTGAASETTLSNIQNVLDDIKSLETTIDSSLVSVDSKIPSGLTMVGDRLKVDIPTGSSGLTDAELRASPIDVNITGTVDINSTGLATEAKQDVLNEIVKTEDTSHATGDKGIMMMGVRVDNGDEFSITDADGDYSPVTLSSKGEIYVANMPNSSFLGVSVQNTISANIFGIQPIDGAINTANSPNYPTLFGGFASTATPFAVSADGDAQYIWLDRNGRQAVWDGNSSLTVDNTKLDSLVVTAGRLQVELPAGGGGLTDTELRATPVPISGTITADTELPAAASLGDDTANPSTTSVGGLNMAFDGTTWDRVRTIDGYSTASSTPNTGLLATIPADRRFTSVSLGTAVNSTQSWDTNGSDSVVIHTGTTTTGTFIFEVSADGSNWQNAEVRLTGNDSWQGGIAQTPTANNIYRVFTVGYRSLRVRTVTTLGATVAFIATLAAHSPAILAIKTGPAPHNIGYTPIHKDVEYTTAQTGTAIWTPASGKKFVVTDITISTGGTTAGIVTLWQGASGDTTYNVGGDPAIFRGEFAPSANSKPGMVKSYRTPFVSTTNDHILRITTSAAMTIYISVDGYEI